MQPESIPQGHLAKSSANIFCRNSTIITALLLSIVMVGSLSLTGTAGIDVTPLLLDLSVDPGTSGTGILTVHNTGAEPIRIEAQVLGFKTSSKGTPSFLSGSAAEEYPYSGEDLLKLEPGEAVLEPDGSRDFTYEVSYPEDTRPFGGRYVGALFQSTPVEEDKEESEGSQINVATRVASLILIRPSEELMVGDEFLEFKVSPEIEELSTSAVYGGEQLLISTLLKNSGNIHIREKEFRGVIRLLDGSGELVEEIEISPHNVLPGTSYELTELWEIPDGIEEELGSYTINVNIEVETPYGNTVEVKERSEVEM